MNNLEELLKTIESRKSLYLIRCDIFDLYSLLYGIKLGNPNFEGMELLVEFHNWIVKKYKIRTSHSWASILSFYSNGNEKALNLFFKEWKEFLENPDDLTFKHLR